MIIRHEGQTFELVRIDGHSYLLCEDGRAIHVPGGGDFGASAVLIAMVVMMVVAAAASAYMQYQMGQQQKKAAKFQSQMYERQAALQKQVGQSKADDIRARNRRMLAGIEAQAGASGVEMAPGTSPLAVMAYSAREAELDALRAQWGGDASAEASFADARMARFQGRNAEYGATMGAGTTLLSGASSAARTYYGATA
jgi:hypothetical protein